MVIVITATAHHPFNPSAVSPRRRRRRPSGSAHVMRQAVAIGAMTALRAVGIALPAVPADVSVAGFDGIEL